jgi:gas vesicle protein
MLLGILDVPSPTPSFSEIGQWVVMLGITIVILERLKALLWAPKPKGEESVTQTELVVLKKDTRTEFDAVKKELGDLRTAQQDYVAKDELKRLEDAVGQLAKDYKELTSQMFQRHERLVEAVQQVALRVEGIRSDIRKDIEATMNASKK